MVISEQSKQERLAYNETEVRFHIIDPVLRQLGYPGGEDVYLKLEEKLEYPYFHIGHKSKKDMPLGFPDYRAGLKGARGSFVIEAKAASVGLSAKDIEQAHSYAAHAEVGANYFVLCDGLSLQVYETLSGDFDQALLTMKVDELSHRFHELENILSPASLAKNCQVSYDRGIRICEGLGSSAAIRSGCYTMVDWELGIYIDGRDRTGELRQTVPALDGVERMLEFLKSEFELKVGEGSVERDEGGRINATVSFPGATKNNLVAMQMLGIDTIVFSTNDEFLSVDPEKPTAFESSSRFVVAEGTMLPPLFGKYTPAECEITGDMFVTARMHKSGDEIVGSYIVHTDYHYLTREPITLRQERSYIGEFNLSIIP